MVLGLPGFARAADPDTDDPAAAKGSWFSRLFSGQSRATAAPKDQKTEKENEKRAPSAKSLAATRVREQAEWARRAAVCNELKFIAIMNHDDDLLRKANQLDQRAWAMYQQRANLPAGASGPQADERLLDRRLGTGTSVGQNLLPASGTGNVSQAALQGGRQ